MGKKPEYLFSDMYYCIMTDSCWFGSVSVGVGTEYCNCLLRSSVLMYEAVFSVELQYCVLHHIVVFVSVVQLPHHTFSSISLESGRANLMGAVRKCF